MGPLLFRVYKGIIINHYKDPYLTIRISMESKRVFCGSFDVSFISLDFHQNSVLVDLQHHKLYDIYCMYIYIYINTHAGIYTYTLDPAPLPVRVPKDGFSWEVLY